MKNEKVIEIMNTVSIRIYCSDYMKNLKLTRNEHCTF